MSSEKVSKETVNYRKANIIHQYSERCGTCSMFRPERSGRNARCTLVKGVIYPGDVCNEWEAK